ncbi:MAG TPA: helix-turn-helix domain-containing protein [Candidatus Massiliomicrobiota merdigallinarum]|nr:helix-turn-helix domain-containing protein [Candidatus Massilimicrobiota merdigallinarum]
MDIKKVGKFIASCRKEKNMTQKQLAEKLSVTDKSVSKWERDIPTF